MSEPVWIDKDLGKVTPTDEQIQTAANTYLEQVITNPDSPPLDRSLTSSTSATPADITGNLKSALDDIDDIVKTKTVIDGLNYVSGGIDNSYKTTDNNTRIRLQGTYTPLMAAGDYVDIDGVFEGKVYASSAVGYGSNVVGEITGGNWVSGKVIIPSTYNNKYIGILLRVAGHESDDISSYVDSVNTYVHFVRVINRIDEIEEQLDGILDDQLITSDNLFIDTTFPMAIFRGNSTITTADNPADGNGAIIRRAKFPEPFEISVDSGYKLTVMKNNGNTVNKYYNQTKMFFDANQLFSIALIKDDSSLITLDDISHLHLRCSQSLKDYLDATYKMAFTGALIFSTPDGAYNTPISRGGFSTTTKLINRTPSYRRTTVEVVSENGFIVMSGYISSTNPGVNVHKINDDNTITTVSVANRTRAVFAAGRYILEYFNSNTSSNTNINSYVYIESIETSGTPSGSAVQLMSPGDQHGQGFMFDEKFNIWILKNWVQGEDSKMYVRKQDNTYTEAISLGMDVGHGNNIIYFGGKVWISDWYNPNIYRFTIDSDEYTATYVDTIEMPNDETIGRIEYIPISDNEIIGVTWSDESREVLLVVRYIKQRTTGSYVEQERFPVSVHDAILQGANYYDGYLYCLMDNSNNVNQGIQVINMKTHNSVFISSNYNTESESVMDVKYNELNDTVNVIIGYEQGTIYRLSFYKKHLPQ